MSQITTINTQKINNSGYKENLEAKNSNEDFTMLIQDIIGKDVITTSSNRNDNIENYEEIDSGEENHNNDDETQMGNVNFFMNTIANVEIEKEIPMELKINNQNFMNLEDSKIPIEEELTLDMLKNINLLNNNKAELNIDKDSLINSKSTEILVKEGSTLEIFNNLNVLNKTELEVGDELNKDIKNDMHSLINDETNEIFIKKESNIDTVDILDLNKDKNGKTIEQIKTEGLNLSTVDSLKFNSQIDSNNIQSSTTNIENFQEISDEFIITLDKLNEDKQATMSIKLKPKELGELSIEMEKSNNGIIAKISVASNEVKELLEKNIQLLQDYTNDKNVKITEIKVVNQSNTDMSFSFDSQNRNMGGQGNSANENKQNFQDEKSAIIENSGENYSSKAKKVYSGTITSGNNSSINLLI
jgi:flagellar hook-length control protein FliK